MLVDDSHKYPVARVSSDSFELPNLLFLQPSQKNRDPFRDGLSLCSRPLPALPTDSNALFRPITTTGNRSRVDKQQNSRPAARTQCHGCATRRPRRTFTSVLLFCCCCRVVVSRRSSPLALASTVEPHGRTLLRSPRSLLANEGQAFASHLWRLLFVLGRTTGSETAAQPHAPRR